MTGYPKAIRPFYMRVNDDGNTVAAMDVLVPEWEKSLEAVSARNGTSCSLRE